MQGMILFDGVYFQAVMEQTALLDPVERDSYFESIQKYRIYT